MNSTSATATPARSAMAMPSPVTSTGLVVTAKSWPAPPVARSTLRAATSTTSPVGASARTPAQRPSRTIRSSANQRSQQRGRGVAHGHDERPLDLGAGGGAAGVDDTGEGVPTLPRQLQPAVGVAVEDRAQGDQLVDPRRALVDQHADRVEVAQPRPGGQRVGQVEVGRVGVGRRAPRPRRPGPSGCCPARARPWSARRPGGRAPRRPAPRRTALPRPSR